MRALNSLRSKDCPHVKHLVFSHSFLYTFVWLKNKTTDNQKTKHESIVECSCKCNLQSLDSARVWGKKQEFYYDRYDIHECGVPCSIYRTEHYTKPRGEREGERKILSP